MHAQRGRPPPLLQVRSVFFHGDGGRGGRHSFPTRRSSDLRAQNTVFEHLAAIKTRNVNLTLADQAERIDMAQASADFFEDRKSTRLNSSHGYISYAVFCLKKKRSRF